MSIAHELSCDVAAAILGEDGAGRAEPASGDALTDIVLEVHTTLRGLTREARRRRLNSQFLPAPDQAPAESSSAASGRRRAGVGPRAAGVKGRPG